MKKLLLKKLKHFFDTYEAELSATTLVSGFIFDYLTLNRVDYFFDNLLIILYLLFAGASIVIINMYEAGKLHNGFIDTLYEFLPFAMQFAFGGLFSAFTIFYSKSASFVSSSLFVVVLFILMVGNEFFKKRYQKLVFQIAIYFVAIFSFSIYFLPVVIKKMGAFVFLESGIISLIFTGLFVGLVSYLAPGRYKESRKFIACTVAGLWALINILYFGNIIPPIPLSLKTGEVYHLVERQAEGGYIVKGEAKETWYEKWNLKETIHLRPGEAAYVFSSVFAPTDLGIGILHDWQYWSEEENGWISASKIGFPVKGGREEGYRGFSKKENIFPGKWRVDIKTDREQVIGRVRFDIEMGNFTENLETRKM